MGRARLDKSEAVQRKSDAPSDHENADKNAAIHYFRKPSSLGKFLELGIIVKAVIGRAQAG